MSSHPASQSLPKRAPRAIPLRTLTQEAMPMAYHALAWSPDAELAVSVDDSVYVYVPRLVGLDGGAIPVLDEPDAGLQPSADVVGADETASRGQFSTHSRRIPIGTTAVDSRINDRLMKLRPGLAQLLPAVQQSPNVSSSEDGSDGGSTPRAASEPPDADADAGADADEGSSSASLLASTGSTMNSIVSIAWSPVGVGRHNRPVLGALTTSGMLLVYGEDVDDSDPEGAPAGMGPGSRAPGPGRRSYDTSQWKLLWAVGGDKTVPGQRKADRIVSFDWTGAWEGPGLNALEYSSRQLTELNPRALLAYTTDTNQLVVLVVFHFHAVDGGIYWFVLEAARRDVGGPHLPPSPGAPSSTPPFAPAGSAPVGPFGTAFGVQCSPWLIEAAAVGEGMEPATTQTCLVGYIVNDYVGFRRMTVRIPPMVNTSNAGHDGNQMVRLDHEDVHGFCMFLKPDSFLKFEPGIWSMVRKAGEEEEGQAEHMGREATLSYMCRAMVATPHVAKAFELQIKSRDPNDSEILAPLSEVPLPHNFGAPPCRAMEAWDSDLRRDSITGLAIHHPHPRNRGRQPFHTFVRWSANAAERSWLGAYPPTDDCVLQWEEALAAATETPGSLEVLPSSMGGRASSGPRIWGLAQAPGALNGSKGVTAVLVTELGDPLASGGRGNQSHRQSQVLFGWQESPVRPLAAGAGPGGEADGRPSAEEYLRPAESTEARMWAYMYGGGPPVMAKAAATQAWPPSVAALIARLSRQTCTICGSPVTASDAVTCVCSQEHEFDRCSATGLAIQRPNISHACGVCGSRTLRLHTLLDMLQDASNSMDDGEDGRGQAAVGSQDLMALRWKVLGDVCRRCGGKFYE